MPTGENNSDNVILSDDDNSKDETENSTPAATSEQCANGHTWDNGNVTTEATCTEKGVKTYTCSVCKETKTEEIEALGHSYGGDGVYTICDAKQEETQETIQECEHDWSDWTETTVATCTTDGKETRKCSVCTKSETRVIDAAGHTWENGTVTTEATCTEKGEKTYTCSVCKETKTEEIEALGHDYVDGVCTCGATKPETEDQTGDPAVEEEEIAKHEAAIEAINALDDYISEIDEFLLSVTNEDGEIVGNDEYDANTTYTKLQEMLSNGLAMYNAIPLDGVELTDDEENLLAGLKEALDGISGIMPIADAVAQIGDTTYETLNEAVKAASDGDKVTLLKDTAENISISTSITLDLGGYTLTGTDDSVVTVTASNLTLTFKNGRITGTGTAPNKGGGINVSKPGCNITIDGLKVTGTAQKEGGAIYINSSKGDSNKATLNINNSTISGTSLYGGNGGVGMGPYGTVNLYSGEICNCSTTGQGGAGIGVSQYGTINMFDGSVYNNTTTTKTKTGASGGIFGSAKSTINIYGGSIYNNQTTGSGGGIAGTGCELTISDGAKICNNTATYYGDDIYVYSDSIVTLNSAKSMNSTLKDNGRPITGWYIDGAKGTGKDEYGTNTYAYTSRWNGTEDDGTSYLEEVSGTLASMKYALKAANEPKETEEEDPTTPDPEPEEETPSNPSGGGSTTITDPETPTTEIPEDVTEIEEEDTPLADAEEVTVIEDEETALADVPQTGDSTNAWYLMTMFSALGLLWLAIDSKKRKAESR